MDVHLLLYDLSRGLARDMSMGFLGFQLDAIYHTSIKLNGCEYVYDGGILSIVPGSSHHGRPMQEMYLGRTELPMDVIEEYLDSLRDIYTAEAYNLWSHNCNNFSNDFATFLLGKGIPDNILHMPRAVLDSPLGRMLMPALNQQVNANRQNGGILGIQESANGAPSKPASDLHRHEGSVKVANNLTELDSLLQSASKTFAIVFFTSATCAPCRMLYPLYDELAAEIGNKGVLIKVDTSQALDVGLRYTISATPTFIAFLKGEQESRWSSSNPAKLRGDVMLLAQMAWPPHPHESLRLPSFAASNPKPVLFTKIPPLDKLLAKMGNAADNSACQAVKKFIETRAKDGPAAASLPDVAGFAEFVEESTRNMPQDALFAVVDLLRCCLIDARFSGFLAEEKGHRTVLSIVKLVNGHKACPYALRLVTLQMACNLFSSPLYPDQILSNEELRTAITQLLSSSFLDDAHNSVRVAAASLLFNVALANSKGRIDGVGEALPQDDQVELAASTLEAITQEEASSEALEGMLLALGYLVYRMPMDSQLADLLRAMEARSIVADKQRQFPKLKLVKEVGEELLGKGLAA